MANDLHPGKKIYPAHGDPIRIVPLHVPDSVSPTDGGGRRCRALRQSPHS